MLVIVKITYCNIHTTLNQYWKARGSQNFGPRATCGPRTCSWTAL